MPRDRARRVSIDRSHWPLGLLTLALTSAGCQGEVDDAAPAPEGPGMTAVPMTAAPPLSSNPAMTAAPSLEPAPVGGAAPSGTAGTSTTTAPVSPVAGPSPVPAPAGPVGEPLPEPGIRVSRSQEHTSALQPPCTLVCR